VYSLNSVVFHSGITVFMCFSAVYSRSVQSVFFFRKNQGRLWNSKSRILEVPHRWLPEKWRTVPSKRGRGQDEEVKGEGVASEAARKTTLQRDGGENLSCESYQGFVRATNATSHQRTCRDVAYEYYEGDVRTDAFCEGHVRQRDGHRNCRGSGRIFR
jgi:hypothetical protein